MKRVFLTFSIIVALASFVSVTAKMGNSLPDEVKILSTQEVNSETKSEHKSKIQEETADLNKALKIIQQLIFGSSPEQSINQKKVFDYIALAFNAGIFKKGRSIKAACAGSQQIDDEKPDHGGPGSTTDYEWEKNCHCAGNNTYYAFYEDGSAVG